MSFMKQLEDYKEFSDRRTPGRSHSHSSGRSDDHVDRKRKKHRHRRKRSRSRSRNRSDRSRSRSSSRGRRRNRCRRRLSSSSSSRSSISSEESDDEKRMERCISGSPTSVILLRGITENMSETILREAIISSGCYPRDVFVARKRRSGRVRGFGFVEFYYQNDAKNFLESVQGTLYIGEERVSLLYCVPSVSPFYESGSTRSGEWNCCRCGTVNYYREVCYRCACPRDDNPHVRSRTAVEKPMFDKVGRSPCNTILIRGLDTTTISEHSIKAALYDQHRVSSSSIRSCFIMRNPPVTETTPSSSHCYAFIELSSTYEATQLIDRLNSKPLEIDGKRAQSSFANYPFTTIMSNIHQWLASASQPGGASTEEQQNEQGSYAPTQTDVTNAAAAVAQAAMMSRHQVEAERAKRRAKRRERAERKRERGERSRRRSSSRSSESSYSGSSGDEGQPTSVEAANIPGLPANLANSGNFQFDASTGYYYDSSTGSYYDPNTRYFYCSKVSKWLMWDAATNQYIPVPQQTEGEGNQAESAVETEEMKKEREKREKAKEARRVHKEMEKWAKNANQIDQTAETLTSKPQPSSSGETVGTGGSVTPQDGADAIFDFIKTSSSAAGADQQQSILDTSITHLLSLLDWQTFICKLCSRKLSSEEQLRKHCAQSDLHKNNTEKWCKEQGLTGNLPALVKSALGHALTKSDSEETPSSSSATLPTADEVIESSYHYRDRAKERRQKNHSQRGGGRDRGRDKSSASSYTVPEGGVSLDKPVEGVGKKLVEKMGWEAGKGLGRHGQGRTDPVEAQARQERVGLGSAQPSVRAGESLDYRQAAKRTLFQRFHELR